MKVHLKDVLTELIDHRGKTPKKLGSDFASTGVPVASAQLVWDGVLHLEDARFVGHDVYKRWMKVPVRRGDVILTSEAPLGRVARVATNDPLVLGQRLFGLRALPGVLDNGYLFYAFQTRTVQTALQGRSTGSTVSGIRQSALRELELDLPPLPEQRAIAEVLGALDDKIAANRSALGVLDGLVRARYLREVANAEAIVPLAEIAENVRSQIAPADIAPGHTYVGLEHIPRRRMWIESRGSGEDIASAKFSYRQGDVLFGKLRPYFHKVGHASRAGVCSTDILVVRAHDQALEGLVLAACTADVTVAAAVSSSEGTRMPRAKWADIAGVDVPDPDNGSMRRLSADIEGLALVADARVEENEHLAATRDALLPLLMSGKVRVKDVEDEIGELV